MTVLQKSKLKTTVKWAALFILGVVLILIVLVGPFLLLSPKPSADPSTVETREDLDQYFTSLTREGIPPAIDITVLKGGQKVFSKAYGVADGLTGEKATSDHVYHYWSMTKSFTAVAIMQLVDKGVISLDSSISTYLPNFVPEDEQGNPVKVTVDNLVSHQSGLPDFDLKMFAWIHNDGEPRFGETRMVAERFQDYKTLNAQPGMVSKYSNMNFVLLGAIIEAVTGGTYEDYIRQEILTPLRMADTDFIYRDDMQGKIARGSQAYYSFHTLLVTLMGPEGGMDAFTKQEIDGRHWLNLLHTDYAASTALIGTSSDMSRFGQMLLNLGTLDGVRILSEKRAQDILYGGRMAGEKDIAKSGDTELALGYGTKTWYLEGIETIGHGGGGPGFALQYFVVPEKELVIVALTNSSLGNGPDLAKLTASVFIKE